MSDVRFSAFQPAFTKEPPVWLGSGTVGLTTGWIQAPTFWFVSRCSIASLGVINIMFLASQRKQSPVGLRATNRIPTDWRQSEPQFPANDGG